MSLPRIPLAGVIGHPVAHSKSPQLHGHWLARYGIAGHYVPMDVVPERLEQVVRTMPEMGFVGVNVTIPHKEKVMLLADQVTDTAKQIGAVNTLVFSEDGSITGDNTDGYGFIANLRQGAPSWTPEAGPAVVLGAGGAARAIVVSLLDAGVPGVQIANRTKERAEQLKAEFGERLTVVDWAMVGDVIADANVLVNTTSLGMTGKPELEIPFEKIQSGTTVTDIVYSPLKTKLLAEAERTGCVTVDGLGMLLHQAVPGFERWFGKRPDVDEELRRVVLG